MRSIILALVLALCGCDAGLKARVRAAAASQLQCSESELQLQLQWQSCPRTPSIVCRQTVSGCGGVVVYDSNGMVDVPLTHTEAPPR